VDTTLKQPQWPASAAQFCSATLGKTKLMVFSDAPIRSNPSSVGLSCSRTRTSDCSQLANRLVRFGTLSGCETPSYLTSSACVAVVRCRAT
jgi:hypothetical protein